MMVEDFILSKEGSQQEILLYLHKYFLSFPGIQSQIRYKIPFYSRNSWINYLNPLKNGGVEIVFIVGQELSNQHGILEAKDRKMVSGYEVHSLSDIKHEALEETWLEALMMDEDKPYKGPKRG